MTARENPSARDNPESSGAGASHSAAPSAEPRWPAVLMVLAAVALHFALPSSMRIGPPWLGAGAVVLLVICAGVAVRLGMPRLNQLAAYALAGALTVALLYGVTRLVGALFAHAESAPVILRSAAILWATNVITFALWYWRLDAGGPYRRARGRGARSGAFLFPQMMDVSDPLPDEMSAAWRPHFVDYLFLAFNTSTAFSPTDVPVLSRWAKVLTMVQSMISFTTVVLLVARAINTI